MLVRPLIALFALCPVAAFPQSQTAPSRPALYASAQPPMQPAAEPAPVPNPTSQPAAPQPGVEPQPEPNPVSQPAPAPVIRTPPRPQAGATSEPPSDKNRAGKTPSAKADNDRPVAATALRSAQLWHDPGNIAAMDLLYGQGGRAGLPGAPFVFESEDIDGTTPKFDARDAKGRKWRVKLGVESRPEVVASRLLWATGYYVNDDYVLESAVVSGIHMKRGSGEIKNGEVKDARFARKPAGQKKIGIWEWKENPFVGTREFNGLRVMMAVMNNWDLKDVNNAVFEDETTGQHIFLVSDVGATFGTNGLSWTHARSKGNVGSFKDSKFIVKTSDTSVSFGTPKPPTARLIETLAIPELKDYAKRSDMQWIGKDIPRQDARWIGSLLKQLSHQQIVDAFRAGHFPPDQIDAYVDLIESRIQELSAL